MKNVITAMKRLPLFVILSLMLSGLNAFRPSPCAADSYQNLSEKLKQNRKLWQSKQVKNYRYRLQASCFCGLAMDGPVEIRVENSRLKSIYFDSTLAKSLKLGKKDQSGFLAYSNVEKIFNEIQKAIKKRQGDVTVTYDPRWGYPTRVNIDPHIPDAQLELNISHFQILKKNRTLFAQSPTNKADLDQEDIALIQAVIAAELPDVKQPLVVERETVSGATLSEVVSMFNSSKSPPQCPPELFKNLKIRNQHPWILPKFKAPMPLIFVSHAHVDQIFKSGFWKEFYEKYPHTFGLAAFSVPSYNADKSAALIYFRFQRGGLDGQGYFYYLVKKSGRWQIKRNLGGWVS